MIDDFPQLLQGCRNGESESLTRFVNEFYGTLIVAARRQLRNQDEAEDAVQGFLLKLIEKNILLRFRGERIAQLRSFLNVCLANHITATSKQRTVNFVDAGMHECMLESSIPPVEDNLERNHIREIIKEINWRYRQVLELELDSYKQREIAEILQLSPGTVASYSKRAKEALSRLLRAHGYFTLPILFILTSMKFIS